ncbi:hypothetical protein AeMF1_010134 [Aphanomyces euteiches]|nr:hypothetical protein AeMF1_010134 [Aphanomyces euteiches]
MWKSSSSIVGKTNGLDDLPMVLQQEINDFLLVAQGRKQQKLIPRINKVDFTKAMPDSEYIVTLQLQVVNKDYVDGWPLSSMSSIASMSLSLDRDRGKFSLAMRIPKTYPAHMPDISCVTGGEYIPAQLKRGASFVLPWIAQGWPVSYTLQQFAEDLCTALSSPEKISTTHFLAEERIFPLDQAVVANQVYPVAPGVHPSTLSNDAQSRGGFPFMGSSDGKTKTSNHGSNKKSTTPTPSSNPFDHSPHTSKQSTHMSVNQRGGDNSAGQERRVEDLINLRIAPPVADLLGFDQPTVPSSSHRADVDQLLVHVPANPVVVAGSPRGNAQSPRGLEAAYRSNECCIKCKYKDEARRFVFDRKLNFQQLQDSIKRLFQFPSSTIVTLVYLDSDGDKCGLSSDEELRAALTHFPDTLVLHADIKANEVVKNEPQPSPPTHQAQGPKHEEMSFREIKIEDVKLEKCIGVGSSCKVYKAIWRGTEVAIKKFTSQNTETVNKEFKHEVQMMIHLGCHPCIVLFLAVCTTPKCIVFEYLPFSLFEQINGSQDPSKKIPPFPNTWQKRLQMIMDVARGLQFLHSFNIVHRDLKSLNLLITDEGRVKLADFGIAKVAQDEFMTRCCGTYQWMAPEVIVSQTYSVSADIYSFGVVMWEICEASVPFADTPAALVAMAVIQENKRPTISPNIPTPLKDLISRCWDREANLRPDAATIVNALTTFLQASQSPT